MSARTYWKCLLTVLVLVSVAGNVGHILLAHVEHPIPSAISAAVPPLLLAAVVEGLALTVGAEVRQWLYLAGVAFATGIAGGAFWVSYVALRDLAAELGFPSVAAPVVPALVDAGMAVATLMVLALRPVPVQASTAAAPLPVHAEPAPAPAPEQGPVPGAAWSADAGAGHLTGHDAVAQAGARAGHGDPQLHLVTAGDGGDAGDARTSSTPTAPVQPEHVEQAEELVARGAVQLPVDRVAQMLALADAGASARSIAETVPANRRTVGKVLAAVGGEEAG